MSLSKPRGHTTFKDEWLDTTLNPDFFWLQKVEYDRYRAYCTICNTQFDIANMGISSIRSHAKGKKHSQKLKASSGSLKLTYFAASSSSSNSQPTSESQPPPESLEHVEISTSQTREEGHSGMSCPPDTIKRFLIKDEVISAEIVWAINQIMTHSSGRSFGACSDIFKIMFKDSEIASKFSMHKDKLGYVVTYGLGPYFQNELVSQIKECPYYCVSFDESLNDVAQKNQMDIVVRYWQNNEIQTRYLTSTFLQQSKAEDLLLSFVQALRDQGLDVKKIINISLDGPNVNLKFLEDLKKYLMKEDLPTDTELVCFGTCSLHVTHNSYKTAMKKSGWKVDKFLRSLYQFFKNYPSRRGEFTRLTGSTLFPLKFCKIRWVENTKVIDRAIEMLPHLRKYLSKVTKEPASENFSTIKSFVNDELLESKLGFVRSVAYELEKYLTKYQSNLPLLPFLYSDLSFMVENLMERVVKTEVLNKAKMLREKLEIDLTKSDNLKPAKYVDIGFAAAKGMKSKNINDQTNLMFRQTCRNFIVDVLMKLIEKSPIKYKFVKGVTCFDPSVITNSAINHYRVTSALEVLVEKKHLSCVEADSAKREYLHFVANNEVKVHLGTFDPKKHRLDVFLTSAYEKFYVDKNLVKFTKLVLIMFHGNAAVERSFSINKNCLIENLHENSLLAQRIVYDAVTTIGGLSNLVITKKMIHAVKNSSQLRNEALKKKKEQMENEESKKKSLAEEIKVIETKKRTILQAAKEAQEQADELEKEVKKLKQML